MLNVNAKSFVPPGAEVAPPLFVENEFRYRLDIPPQRAIDPSNNARTINSVSPLLTSKFLFADRGARDLDSLRYFVSQSFLSAVNMPSPIMENRDASGFLLSKPLLAMYSDMATISNMNDAPGFVLRIDTPREHGADVTLAVTTTWEQLYNRLHKDARVCAFGYSRSLTGANTKVKLSGSYRHYIFVACTSYPSQEKLTASQFADLPLPLARVTPVSSVVPFMCGFRCPLAVFITVGDKAKAAAFSTDTSADFSFEMEFYLNDFGRTMMGLSAFEGFFLSTLTQNRKWEKTQVMHLHINTRGKSSSNSSAPIWDILVAVGNLCDDTGCSVGGVSLSDKQCVPGCERIFSLNPSGPFYVNMSCAAMIEHQVSLDTTNALLGNVPLYLCRGISHAAVPAASRALTSYLPALKEKHNSTQQLTRMNFADAADQFAKYRFFVRRRMVGSAILLGTDANGNPFGIDVKTNSVFALKKNAEVPTSLPHGCIFSATLCSSPRGYYDYLVVINDVLAFQDINLQHLPFSERWRHAETMGLEEEELWPHSTPSHIAYVRAGYAPFEATEYLTRQLSGILPTVGLIFVNNMPTPSSEHHLCAQYCWVPPCSLTLRFSIEKIQAAPEGNTELQRLYLAVAESSSTPNKLVTYEHEFVDVQIDGYDGLMPGCIMECILRRAEDGAHWWDAVRDFAAGAESVSTFAQVDELVHSPGITKQEMLWLLNAPSFQCERCKKVNDAGRYNQTRKVYWCKNCWVETGHGDCAYCNRGFTTGMMDSVSKLFYCSTCWGSFSTCNTKADVGYHVPPPPNASFTTQVATRCISLLIDFMNPRCPSNDVLDLCCGGSVVRKWMRNKTTRYVGIDVKTSVVDAATETITKWESERPIGARYDVVCADVFSPDFWTQTVPKIHSRQFHIVSCFSGLHHAFSDEERARSFVARVANALVPGGVFIGFATDASVLFGKGPSFENSVVKVEWNDDAVPRIGHTFNVTTENGPVREENVIPIDFLIAVASEYALEVISEACLTFRELIEKDGNWTKVPSADEKEYLCALRTFAFKKEGSEQAPSEVRALV